MSQQPTILERATKSREDAIICFASRPVHPPISPRDMIDVASYPAVPWAGPGPTFVDIPSTINTRYQPRGPFSERTGALRILPNELTTAICHSLDIKSLLRFRRVCRIAREVGSSMMEYQFVVEEAPNVVDACIRTEIADRFTFAEVYKTMCLVACEECGKIGHYVYLLLMVRVCTSCLTTKSRFHTVTLPSFCRVAKKTQLRLRKEGVHVLRSLNNDGRIKLVNLDEASQATHTSLGSFCYGEGYRFWNASQIGRWKATTVLPFFDAATMTSKQMVYCRGCQRTSLCLYSAGIVDQKTRKAMYERQYSRSEFLAHFDVCSLAQKAWTLSQNGTFHAGGKRLKAAVLQDEHLVIDKALTSKDGTVQP